MDLWLHGLLSGFRTTVQQDSSASARPGSSAMLHTVLGPPGCGTSAGRDPSINEFNQRSGMTCAPPGRGQSRVSSGHCREPLDAGLGHDGWAS